jgi:hypothetical protein
MASKAEAPRACGAHIAAISDGGSPMSNSTTAKSEPRCMCCYERGVEHRATRGTSPNMLLFCFECWLGASDRRCLAEAITDKRPEGATVH